MRLTKQPMWSLPKEISRLAATIERLAGAVNNNKLDSILERMAEMEKNIMATVAEWAAKVGPKLDRVQVGLDAVQKLVEEFQNSPGGLSPSDQVLLDKIEAQVDAIATDADSVPATPPPA